MMISNLVSGPNDMVEYGPIRVEMEFTNKKMHAPNHVKEIAIHNMKQGEQRVTSSEDVQDDAGGESKVSRSDSQERMGRLQTN